MDREAAIGALVLRMLSDDTRPAPAIWVGALEPWWAWEGNVAGRVILSVYGHWQGFYRDGVIEGLVVRADDVPAAERAVAIELARRAYPAAFPSP